MLKMKEKQRQNNPYKARRTTLMVGVMIFLMAILCVNSVSAFDWTDNIVSYWDFDETSGTTVNDDVNGYDGTTQNMDDSNWVSGKIGNGLLFGGTNEYVTVGNQEFLNITGNQTISLWVNMTPVTHHDGQRLISKDSYFIIWYGDTGTGYYATNLGNSGTGTPATNNTWHHIVGRNNQSHLSLFVDGAEISSSTDGGAIVLSEKELEFGRNSVGAEYLEGTLDEVGIWNRSLNDTEIAELYNEGSGLPYAGESYTEFSVQLISPEDEGVLSAIAENFTVNYNITGTAFNWTNSTYYVWHNNGTIFNNTVVEIIKGITNTTTVEIDAFVLGNYLWNVYACYENSTFSNCTWAAANYSLDVGASVSEETYLNESYETASANFSANITLIAGANLYDAQVYYNGTSYSGTITDLGNETYKLYAVLDIPVIGSSPTNLSWFWRLTYEKSGGSFTYQNLSSHNQTISNITLFTTGCSGNNLSLNFSSYNEENLTVLSDYSFDATFEYWLGSGTSRKNISISNASVSKDIHFCIHPSNLTYYSDAQIQYEKEGFVKRSYYLINSSLTNTTNHIGLYLLNTSSATSFIINIIDSVQFPVTDAYIYIQRYYPGTGVFHTVEMAQTDDSGNTIGHFEAETEDYKIIVFKSGVILFESNKAKVFCGETPCTLNFQTAAAAPTTWQDIGDLPNLIWSLTYNETSHIWKYTYVDTSGTTNYGRLFVYIEDGSSRTTICNKTDSSSAATLTCNVTGYDGTIYAEVYISRSPEILVWLDSIVERLTKAIFGMEGLFWATMILLTIGLIGLWNPSIGIVMMVAGVILIGYLQLAGFGITTILGIVFIGVILLWQMRK